MESVIGVGWPPRPQPEWQKEIAKRLGLESAYRPTGRPRKVGRNQNASPGEDRSDVGWAGQFNNIGPVPLSRFRFPASNIFAKLKALLRKIGERSIDGLWRSLGRLLVLDEFTPQDCRNFHTLQMHRYTELENALTGN